MEPPDGEGTKPTSSRLNVPFRKSSILTASRRMATESHTSEIRTRFRKPNFAYGPRLEAKLFPLRLSSTPIRSMLLVPCHRDKNRSPPSIERLEARRRHDDGSDRGPVPGPNEGHRSNRLVGGCRPTKSNVMAKRIRRCLQSNRVGRPRWSDGRKRGRRNHLSGWYARRTPPRSGRREPMP